MGQAGYERLSSFCIPPILHQGVVNHPPAFSNPRAWIQFHATFDFFYWIMCCGSGDSRSHNRSSSLLSSVSPLYHTERKLVLEAVEATPGITLSALREQDEHLRVDHVYALIARNRLYVDLYTFWLKDQLHLPPLPGSANCRSTCPFAKQPKERPVWIRRWRKPPKVPPWLFLRRFIGSSSRPEIKPLRWLTSGISWWKPTRTSNRRSMWAHLRVPFAIG